jgi:hypothetical protein
LKWVVAALAAVVLLTIVASLAVPFLVDTARVKNLIATSASHALGRPVRFREIALRLFPLPSAELRGVEVAEDPKFGTTPFLQLEKGTVRLRLLPLLAGRLEFSTIVLTQPAISLIRDGQGRWNVATLRASSDARPSASSRTGPSGSSGGGGSPGTGAAGAMFSSRLKIEKGAVTYARRQGAALSRYRLEDLDLTVRGEGTTLAVEGTARLRPGDLRIKLAGVSLALPGPRAALFDAVVGGTIDLEGKDVTELVASAMGPQPAVAGGVKGTVTLTGTLGAPRIQGPVELSNLTLTETRAACPPPQARTLALPTVTLAAAWQQDRFVAHPLATALDAGTITTDVDAIVDRGLRVELTNLAVKTLPLEKVVVDFLCAGYAVTGPLDLTGALGLRAGNVLKTLTGRGQLHVGAGKVVGRQALAVLGTVVRVGGALSSVLADAPTVAVPSPLEFDSVTATYEITDGVVSTRDLRYTSRAMKIAARGSFTLDSGAMNLDLDVDHGRGRVSARVTGTTASPVIRVAPSSVLTGVDPGTVESGLKDLLKRFGR